MNNFNLPSGSYINFLPTRSKVKPWLARCNLKSGKRLCKAFESLENAQNWIYFLRNSEQDTVSDTSYVKSQSSMQSLKFKDLIFHWFEDSKSLWTHNTRESYSEAIRKYLIPFFGNFSLDAISVSDVLDFISQQKNRKTYKGEYVTSKTIQNLLTPLSQLFEYYIIRGIIFENPVTVAKKRSILLKRNVERVRVDKKTKEKFLTRDEVQLLLQTALVYGDVKSGTKRKSEWSKGEIYYPIFFALNTGLRLGEISALTWDDIKYKGVLGEELKEPLVKVSKTRLRSKDPHGMHILQNHTKGKEERDVPLNKTTLQALLQWKNFAIHKGYSISLSSPLFPITFKYTSFKSMVRRVAEKAGLPPHKRGLHCNRHAFATYMLESGASLAITSRLLGHKDLQVTMRYLHLSGVNTEGATENLNWVNSKEQFLDLKNKSSIENQKQHENYDGNVICFSKISKR